MNLWNRGNSHNRGIGANPENLILSACIELLLNALLNRGINSEINSINFIFQKLSNKTQYKCCVSEQKIDSFRLLVPSFLHGQNVV